MRGFGARRALFSTALLAASRPVVSLAASPTAATCFCGAVGVEVAAAAPISSSICHCTRCRKLSGAPHIASVILAREHVTLTSTAPGSGEPALVETVTSKHVTRFRCASCLGPVLATLGPSRCVVPAAIFDAPLPSGWAPQHHIHYLSRILDVRDGLPKHGTNFGSPLVPEVAEEGGSGG